MESLVQEVHHSEASLPTPRLQREEGPRIETKSNLTHMRIFIKLFRNPEHNMATF